TRESHFQNTIFFSSYTDWQRCFNSYSLILLKLHPSRTRGHIPEHHNILFSEFFGVREIEIDIDNVCSVLT
ncbi:MAG: hypothetical protein QN819_08710, partial [Nitrososphaeraceae archaeon]|nr:hypothetical protein [Nitrososphaeraceae archaeon]